MLRIEIIANHSVEENILEAFAEEQVGKHYTKFPDVYGVGSAGPRMGDAIWPEVNFALVIWCEEDEARGIERAVAHVKEHFPDEGVKIFGLPEHAHAAARIAPAAVPHIAATGAARGPAYQPSPSAASRAPKAPVAPAYSPPPASRVPRTPAEPVYVPPPGLAQRASSYVPAAPVPAYTPPAPGQVETEYDGQNMDEEP
jgi:hypothetical protein